MEATTKFQQLIAYSKAHGFLFNSSEIYGGLQAVYDYGPYGVLLKQKLKDFWWRSMTQLHHNIVGLDSAILMAPAVWEASGHVAGFHDWKVDHRVSKKRYRVDVLIETHAAALSQQGNAKAGEALLAEMHDLLTKADGDGLTKLLKKANIVCPIAKTSDWTETKQFNLMLSTQLGAVEKATHQVYLRPETAQGIYVNFLNVQKSTRLPLPFGIAQMGKAFRNEIVARQFIFRMREFEQMEMQFFIPPGEDKQWFSHWIAKRQQWYKVLGIPAKDMAVHPHTQLAHYASEAVDLTYAFPFGSKEVEGIHARMDFDLKNHATLSKKKLTYFDPQRNQSYIPHVIETSVGCDRLVLLLLCHAFTQTAEEGTSRTYLKFPPALAPISAAILPLVKKPPLVQQAQAIFKALSPSFALAYDAGGSIGKRYTRQDLIGTPYCITIDNDTLADAQVTIRFRDTKAQQRLPIADLPHYLQQRCTLDHLLAQLA